MIIGIILKNFKCYHGMHYIPLTNADNTNFCGIIGLNGVGKSTVLEALDCFFNNREWKINIGMEDIFSSSYVVPIFVVNDKKNNAFVTNFSNTAKSFFSNIPTTIPSYYKPALKKLQKHIAQLSIGDKLLLPIVKDKNGLMPQEIYDYIYSVTPINSNPQNTNDIKNRDINLCRLLINAIQSYTYIYIPKDIIHEGFIKFENNEIQKLIGTNLIEIIKKQTQLTKSKIKEISHHLKDFVNDLSNYLPGYEFRPPHQLRKPRNIKAEDIYNFIANSFFSKLELCKIVERYYMPLSQLSSGEKQQVMITFLYSIIKNYRKSKKPLIIAIDEPESSFHITERFEQFNKLYEISKNCNQVLFSSQWYGFIPSIPDGCVVNIVDNDGNRSESVLDIYKYKEEAVRLPVDISLKGNSELIQTILSSILIDNSYNWLICEGTSDKIYLEEYLNKEITDKKLRIIPIGGCSHIKKIYSYLALSLLDLKIEDIKGQIFLLVDTDEDKVDEYKNPELPKDIKTYHTHNVIQFKRLVNIKKTRKTILSEFGANTKTATDIEGVLNGKAFNKVIINNFKTELPFVTEDEKNEIPSAFALDLKDSEKDALKAFFTPQNKVRFARAYVEELQKGNYKVPDWITEIKKFFNS